jgi:hypothetical protein
MENDFYILMHFMGYIAIAAASTGNVIYGSLIKAILISPCTLATNLLLAIVCMERSVCLWFRGIIEHLQGRESSVHTGRHFMPGCDVPVQDEALR